MKFHTRCKCCQARRKLTKHPDEYQLLPKCLSCGERRYAIDEYRQQGKDKRPVCRSDCLPYHHRMGCQECKLTKEGIYK